MERKTMILEVILLTLSVNGLLVSCTKRPIIGILAQEIPESGINGKTFSPAKSYLAASYVKATESSGARVVPLLVNQPESYYKHIMKSINGVVIPGGSATLKPDYPYYDAATIIFQIANEMNKNGNYFPILAICLGFEAVIQIFNNHNDIQQRCDVRHENHPLKFQPKFRNSLQFSNIADDTLLYLKYFPTTKHNHVWCVTIHNFTKTRLPEEWNVVATSTSQRGYNFISSVEHKKYPYIAIIFHPEKVSYEWGETLNTPHGRAAIQANRHFYDLLVTLSKLNYNKFENEKLERKALIYNYQPVDSHTDPPAFEQIYVFSN